MSTCCKGFTGPSVAEAGAALCCFSSDTLPVSEPEASKETTFPHISTFPPILVIPSLLGASGPWYLVTRCWKNIRTYQKNELSVHGRGGSMWLTGSKSGGIIVRACLLHQIDCQRPFIDSQHISLNTKQNYITADQTLKSNGSVQVVEVLSIWEIFGAYLFDAQPRRGNLFVCVRHPTASKLHIWQISDSSARYLTTPAMIFKVGDTCQSLTRQDFGWNWWELGNQLKQVATSKRRQETQKEARNSKNLRRTDAPSGK